MNSLNSELAEGLRAAFKDDRPHILTNAAFEMRKLMVMEAASDGGKNGKPFKRLMAVVDWNVLHEHPQFKGRANDPADVEEFREFVAEGLSKLPPEYGDFQFTQRAHRRVSHSPFEDELRSKVFHQKVNIDLLEVELAILKLEQEDGHYNGIDLEPDVGAELVSCERRVKNVCAGEFLPKTLDPEKPGGDRGGNYTPDDLVDPENGVIMAMCLPCFRNIKAGLVQKNKEIAMKNVERRAKGEPTVPFLLIPRMLSQSAASDALERKKYAIRMQKKSEELEQKRVEAGQRRLSETNDDVRKSVERAEARSQFVPSLRRGESRKNGRGNGSGR